MAVEKKTEKAVEAAAEATGNGEFQSAVDKVGGAATDACGAVVKFGATVAESAGNAAALGVEKLAGVIKGKKNSIEHQAIFAKNDLNINNEDENQIISDTPNN